VRPSVKLLELGVVRRASAACESERLTFVSLLIWLMHGSTVPIPASIDG